MSNCGAKLPLSLVGVRSRLLEAEYSEMRLENVERTLDATDGSAENDEAA